MKVLYTLTPAEVCAISILAHIDGNVSGEFVDNLLKVEYNITLDQKSMLDTLLSQEGSIAEDKSQKSQWPSKGDKYYYIVDDGDIYCDSWDTIDDGRPTLVDAGRRDIGNIFKAKEEATFERERLKVLEQLKRLSDDNQEWDGINLHFHIIYDTNADMFEVHMYSYMILPHVYWFKTRESAEAAIKAIGEDNLKKYVFNVKE